MEHHPATRAGPWAPGGTLCRLPATPTGPHAAVLAPEGTGAAAPPYRQAGTTLRCWTPCPSPWRATRGIWPIGEQPCWAGTNTHLSLSGTYPVRELQHHPNKSRISLVGALVTQSGQSHTVGTPLLAPAFCKSAGDFRFFCWGMPTKSANRNKQFG